MRGACGRKAREQAGVGDLHRRDGIGLAAGEFPTPVPISGNTVYVASYYCPEGHYSADVDYFATSGVDRAPLHFLAERGLSYGNGVFTVWSAECPSREQTWKAANYWVDVVFEPGTAGQDTIAPTLTAIAPESGASGVGLGFRSDGYV